MPCICLQNKKNNRKIRISMNIYIHLILNCDQIRNMIANLFMVPSRFHFIVYYHALFILSALTEERFNSLMCWPRLNNLPKNLPFTQHGRV